MTQGFYTPEYKNTRVYIEVCCVSSMEQKTMSIEQSMKQGAIIESPPIYQQVFKKEQTLRSIVEIFAKKEGYKGNIDKLAKHLIFSIDGAMFNSLKYGGIAKLLDVIVKPTQMVQLIPAIKAG